MPEKQQISADTARELTRVGDLLVELKDKSTSVREQAKDNGESRVNVIIGDASASIPASLAAEFLDQIEAALAKRVDDLNTTAKTELGLV